MTTMQMSPEIDIEVHDLLQQATYFLDAYSRNYLRTYGLTVPQRNVLRYATPEGVPLSEISTRMMCDNSNLTAIVDRLVAEGLVERETAAYDRRVRLIRITQAGSQKLEAIGPHYANAVKHLTQALSDEQVQQLCTLLEALQLDMLEFTPSTNGHSG